MNERNLYDTATDMEEEVTKANAISELIRILYTAACGHRFTNTTFDDIQDALWLIWSMCEQHKDNLYEIIHGEMKNKEGTAV